MKKAQMLVVLNLYDGQVFRQKIWLRDSQVARVGSTEWADFSVEDDLHMSGVHFLIAVTDNGCLLRDLSSRNGTLVNGERIIRQRLLTDGDLITAGKTMFSVEVDEQKPAWMSKEGDDSPPPSSKDTWVSENVKQIPLPPNQSRLLKDLPKLPYTRDRLESGLSVFRALTADDSAADFAAMLMGKRQSYFVINMSAFTKSSMIPFFSRVAMISDDVGIIEVKDRSDVDEIIYSSWGKDSTFFVQSDAEKEAVAEHILSVVSAFNHPSTLRQQLLTAPSLYVSKIMNLLASVVIERRDGASWELYSLSENDDWQQIGFPDAPLQRDS